MNLSEEQISISSAGSQVYLSAGQLVSGSRLVSLYGELYARTRAHTLHSLNTLPELASAQVIMTFPACPWLIVKCSAEQWASGKFTQCILHDSAPDEQECFMPQQTHTHSSSCHLSYKILACQRLFTFCVFSHNNNKYCWLITCMSAFLTVLLGTGIYGLS